MAIKRSFDAEPHKTFDLLCKAPMAVILKQIIMWYHFMGVKIWSLTLKAPITTAADDKFCDILPSFRQK